MRRPALAQVHQRVDNLATDVFQTKTEVSLLVLIDSPSPGVVRAKQERVASSVRLLAEPAGRHVLRIGSNAIALVATEPGESGEQLLPSRRRHVSSPEGQQIATKVTDCTGCCNLRQDWICALRSLVVQGAEGDPMKLAQSELRSGTNDLRCPIL